MSDSTTSMADRCPTPCDPDCNADCHETHDVPAKRGHQPEECPARVGEAIAAELATLLPRLPRVKITPETISQSIIDRWYGYETEYRQTIAGLRAELAGLRDRIGKGRIEWGYGPTAQDVTPASSAVHAAEVAWRRNQMPWWHVVGDWQEVPDGK